MRTFLFATVLMTALAAQASAQTPFVYKPIDTNKLLVQPGDAISGATAGTTTSLFRTMTRSVANAIENNGFVRTINNLLGRRAQPVTVQGGYSPLPLASTYQSSRYPNSFTPVMPVQSAFGRSPAVVTSTPPVNR